VGLLKYMQYFTFCVGFYLQLTLQQHDSRCLWLSVAMTDIAQYKEEPTCQ